jgi:hypothetical protein
MWRSTSLRRRPGAGAVVARAFREAPAILAASKSQLLQARGIGDDLHTTSQIGEKRGPASELKRIQDFGCQI